MLFESRCHWWPSDARSEAEYEDAYGVDADAGRLAVADGVSSGFRSRSWAQLLTAATLKAPPDVTDGEAIEHWLKRPRADWAGAFNPANLPWMQRGKYQACGGGYSTLQWVELTPDEHQSGVVHYLSVAVGDCCLFHIRDGRLLRSFPMTSAADFDLDPASLFSHRSPRDATIEFAVERGVCSDGDFLMLATDALAHWFLHREESGANNDWQELWEMTRESWINLVERLRKDGEIRVDDTTLVMAKIGEYQPAETPGDGQGSDDAPASDVPSMNEAVAQGYFLPDGEWQPADESIAGESAASDLPPADVETDADSLPSFDSDAADVGTPPNGDVTPSGDGERARGWFSFFRGSGGD